MATYEVNIELVMKFCYTVKAQNRKEAEKKALAEYSLDMDVNDYGCITDSNKKITGICLIEEEDETDE